MADDGPMPRWIRWLTTCIRHPLVVLRHLWPFGWSERGIILLVMQTVDNHLRGVWRRSWLRPWRRTLQTRRDTGNPIPTSIPVGNEVARRVAKRLGGAPRSALNEVLLDIPTTAHILGGCVIGPDPERGVVDASQAVYGYEGLYICDGSTVSANLGVNPSLTITAMTERAMSLIPAKERPTPDTVAD
jgi:cholesterol oxidase